jgi:hypothetical protein
MCPSKHRCYTKMEIISATNDEAVLEIKRHNHLVGLDYNDTFRVACVKSDSLQLHEAAIAMLQKIVETLNAQEWTVFNEVCKIFRPSDTVTKEISAGILNIR